MPRVVENPNKQVFERNVLNRTETKSDEMSGLQCVPLCTTFAMQQLRRGCLRIVRFGSFLHASDHIAKAQKNI